MSERKHVTPADPAATIPDEHGRDLPAEGAEITWSAHWAALDLRGDIIVADVQPAPAPAKKKS